MAYQPDYGATGSRVISSQRVGPNPRQQRMLGKSGNVYAGVSPQEEARMRSIGQAPGATLVSSTYIGPPGSRGNDSSSREREISSVEVSNRGPGPAGVQGPVWGRGMGYGTGQGTGQGPGYGRGMGYPGYGMGQGPGYGMGYPGYGMGQGMGYQPRNRTPALYGGYRPQSQAPYSGSAFYQPQQGQSYNYQLMMDAYKRAMGGMV